MIKFYTKNGHIAYRTTIPEILSTGGYGICDECGRFSPSGGFLVPVLLHWQCPTCFKEWQAHAKHYPEDDQIELEQANIYERMIPVTARIQKQSNLT